MNFLSLLTRILSYHFGLPLARSLVVIFSGTLFKGGGVFSEFFGCASCATCCTRSGDAAMGSPCKKHTKGLSFDNRYPCWGGPLCRVKGGAPLQHARVGGGMHCLFPMSEAVLRRSICVVHFLLRSCLLYPTAPVLEQKLTYTAGEDLDC